jgi:hypothetical protein
MKTKKVNTVLFSIIAPILVVLFTIFISETMTQHPVIGQTEDVIITTTPTMPLLLVNTVENNINEVEVLKAQLEIITTYSDRITNAFIGTGAIIITLISVFLGLNLYINNRQYKNDIEMIKDQLKKSLDLNTDISFTELKTKIDTDISKFQSQASSRIDSQFNSMRFDLLKLQIDQLEMSAQDWANKGVIVNEISSYTKMILLDPTRMTIDFTLNNLLKALGKEKVKLDSDDIGKIMTALERIDKKYQPISERIIDLAKSKINPY